MKIAYLFHLNEPSMGVHKKIVAQIAIWKTDGHNVAAFQVTGTTPMLTPTKQWHLFTYKPSLKKFASRIKAWDDAVKSILAWKPDVVYYRYDKYYPALRRLVNNIPVVVEVNTDDVKEYSLNSKIKGLYNLSTRSLIFRNLAGIVFVTNELASLPYFRKYNRKFIVIGNGIDLENYKPLPPANNKYPRLVFMGSPGQPWHGVDKIVKLALKQPLWFFDLVGVTEKDLGVDIPKNITCHGYMNRMEYEKIMARADVAIGTLALHRNKMNEATPLKVREYLAFGLPIIIGYKDIDFPDEPPFILQLPNCENNVEQNMELIQNFIEKWMGNRVARSEVLHLDLREKEKQRIKFMEGVISNI